MEEILSLRIYQTLVGIIGILGNGLVCVVIWKTPAMQNRTNAFIFHQAVIDFLGSTMILLKSEVPVPDPIPDNALGVFLCHVWYTFILFFFFVLSSFNLLILTMERYFAIVHPFKYQVTFSSWPHLKVGLAMAMCWVCAIAIKSYLLFIYDEQDGVCAPVVRSQVLGILTLVLQYVLPVTVMLFAYIRIGVEMKRGAARVGPTSVAEHSASGSNVPSMAESLLQARRNTFKMLLIVFITFLVCWTPNQVLFFAYNIGFYVDFENWLFLLSVAMVATNSCVNPMIYGLKYRQFRKGLREMVCGRRNIRDEFGTMSTSVA
ncbi:trissin receptor-like [Asterias rubens]|uniref:trissin receptor-like n=1 Tax=Asterias rubens TaxID=7604 RepID=UPI001455AE37|nr:trissin receptor-like [Asterias rubens]